MIGIDLVQVIRMKRILEDKYGGQFLRRMFTEEERNRIAVLPFEERSRTAAEIFAAKESVVKASATKLGLKDFSRINVCRVSSSEVIAVVSCTDDSFRVSISALGGCILAVAVAIEHV